VRGADGKELSTGGRNEGFPRELLAHTAGERAAYFRDKIVSHTILKAVLGEVKTALRYPAGDASLLWVVGPSGVGKTTLSKKIFFSLFEEHKSLLKADPGAIVAALVEVMLTAAGKFDWADLYIRLLAALNEPLIENKIDPIIQQDMFSRDMQMVHQKRVELRKLRHAVESCLSYRKVRAVLFDEAHHLKKVAVSGRSLLDQMDTLKSLANATNVPMVLFGTYELLGLMELSDQLCRRSTCFHFRRYRFDSEADVSSFGGVLRTFLVNLPLKKEPALTNDLEYFYTHSLGCVGLLKTWLYKALVAALEDGERQSFGKYLHRQRLAGSELTTILHRILEGENWLKNREDHSGELSVLLGIDPSYRGEPGNSHSRAKGGSRRATPNHAGAGSTDLNQIEAYSTGMLPGMDIYQSDQDSTDNRYHSSTKRAIGDAEGNESKAQRPGRKGRVGERKPYRDAVGM